MDRDPWDPRQYERFRAERQQPFFDLLAMVRPLPPGTGRVVDLGCGTGELTRSLHRQLQARATLGVDSSPAMLARSAAYAEPGLRFEHGDIAGAAPPRSNDGPYDLIFSNAALQWVPDHRDLLARLTSALGPQGQLAVQVPANHDHPSHQVARAVAAEAPFAAAAGRQVSVLLPEQYADCLDRLGYREQQVQLRVYGHHLSGPEDVVEWVKGTLLTDYQQRLEPALFQRFLLRYRERLLPMLEDRRPYFYPFKRILFWARR